MPSRIRLYTTVALSTLLASILVVLVALAPCSTSFETTVVLPQKNNHKRISTTRRHFRDSLEESSSSSSSPTTLTENDGTDPVVTANLLRSALLAVPPPSSETAANRLRMPLWLQNINGHEYERNWNRLQTAMMESFYTKDEVERLEFAIRQASMGDRSKMAGAADFCFLLVETMEMSIHVLVASVFHFCSCIVAARERSLVAVLPQVAGSSSSYSSTTTTAGDPYTPNGLEVFGEHAMFIAEDAARLKRLEMIAATVMHHQGDHPSSSSSSRVTPDLRDSENLKHLLLAETKDWRALAIRSAACLYRLRGIVKNCTSCKLTRESSRVSREALHIYAPLASRLGMHRLKNELEGIAFSILYRRQYETVNALAREVRGGATTRSSNTGATTTTTTTTRSRATDGGVEPTAVVGGGNHHHPVTSVDITESMQQILSQVKQEMTEMLTKDTEFSSLVRTFTVTARVKEPYSMWKKMLHNRYTHILQVPDAVALRIVLEAATMNDDEPSEVTHARERALCYYAQKLCKQRWKPVEGDARFKDYILRPKRNGYQSLHYTASTNWGGDDWSLEIQVRSAEMHKVAEFGLASHWDYKAQQKAKKESSSWATTTTTENHPLLEDPSTDSYLRSLQEWHWQHRGAGAAAPAATIGLVKAATTKDKYQWDAHPESSDPVVLSKLRSEYIRERSKQLEPYLEALTTARSNLERKSVFVFFSSSSSPSEEWMPQQRQQPQQGKVLSLPAGACVLDALREAEKQQFYIPSTTTATTSALSISCNGVPVTITTKLGNGDVLKINTRNTQPQT